MATSFAFASIINNARSASPASYAKLAGQLPNHIMSRSSKRWLLVACALIGILLVYWLGDQKKPPVTVSFEPAPAAVQSTPRDRPDDKSEKTFADGRAEPPVKPAPAGALTTEKVQPSIDGPLNLVFQAPSHVRVGDNFDVRVMVTGRRSIGNIVVEVAYDPALLRVRTLEEIDYGVRVAGDSAFSITQSNEAGEVELLLRQRGAALAVPLSAALVQFEAIASGSAAVLIESISAADPTEGPVSSSAIGEQILIAVE